MKIIVDAMGGDNAPSEIVKGAVMAAREFGVDIVLVGRGEDILKVFQENGMKTLPGGIEIAHASEVVEMDDNPTYVLKEKKDSSMSVALRLLRDGGGDAFVSAGNTGALLSGATLAVKRIQGIRRAAIATVLPTSTGGALLIDSGANVECKPEYLLQFAYMGSYYMKKVMDMERPRVGLLNIGTEEVKGTALQKEAYMLLKQADEEGHIRFTGNIEPRDVPGGGADVIVTDGFSGNIMLKAIEGIGLYLIGEIKSIFKKSALTKFAALMVKGGLKEFKGKMDYKEVGGAPLLGISMPVIKAHGSSDAYAMRSAIRQAQVFASAGIIEDIRQDIEYMKVSPETV